MTFAEKLLSLRKSAALSQEELAEKLNVSRQAVSRWEMGTAMPDSPNLLEISRLFNVSADYLLRDEIERDEEIPAVKKVQSSMDARRNRENAFLVMTTLLAFSFILSLFSWFRGAGFFGILSCTVLQAALITGFELGFRRQGSPCAEAAAFRRKFHLACAWLCTFA
ncbi:MAG: helix-turn-helix transcriptional regulator, partial [Oscillospiraceae bacterium]|nr:helix-turn-helix transcriptional regulator [Oscillospiraceae bacterium]